MVNVFSFVIYGNASKYIQGLLTNIKLIKNKYPDWQIWIYYGADVDNQYLDVYKTYQGVKLIPTNKTGDILRSYRFFPIDDISVDVCIVRDADSRVNDRDDVCIKAFLESPHLFHIIRDHPNHNHRVMAGMWGIKKGALNESITALFNNWSQITHIDGWSDTVFLCNIIYPKVYQISLIHDDENRFNERSVLPIPHTRNDKHFIGQVYEYTSLNEEYPKFEYLRT